MKNKIRNFTPDKAKVIDGLFSDLEAYREYIEEMLDDYFEIAPKQFESWIKHFNPKEPTNEPAPDMIAACKAMLEYISGQWSDEWENRPECIRMGELAITNIDGNGIYSS